MSEVKTLKQEALDLLALDELTGKQMWELDILTLKQVGWSIKKVHSGYYAAYNPAGEIDMGMDIFMSEVEGWVWVRKVHPFCTSVDACLTLPIGLPVAGAWWNLHSDAHNLRYTRDKKCGARIMSLTDEIRGATLPLAMLKAWWSTQPHN